MGFQDKVLVMQKLRDLPDLPAPTHQGFIPGFRTWTLTARNQHGQQICRVSEKRSNNALKYVDFINHLLERGYKLTKDQRHYLKYDTNLGFMDKSYIGYMTYGNLVQLVNMAGFSEQQARECKHKSEDIRRLFAERLGLQFHELEELIAKFVN